MPSPPPVGVQGNLGRPCVSLRADVSPVRSRAAVDKPGRNPHTKVSTNNEGDNDDSTDATNAASPRHLRPACCAGCGVATGAGRRGGSAAVRRRQCRAGPEVLRQSQMRRLSCPADDGLVLGDVHPRRPQGAQPAATDGVHPDVRHPAQPRPVSGRGERHRRLPQPDLLQVQVRSARAPRPRRACFPQAAG